MRIVVKIGSSVLVKDGRLHITRLQEIVREMSALWGHHSIAIVTSGAVAMGHEYIASLKRHHPSRQILASVGQPHLVAQYFRLFSQFSIPTAQILVTRDDFHFRPHYLRLRSTLNGIWDQNILPLLNENDVVSSDDSFDNDQLATLTAVALDADVLCILFDGEGFVHQGQVQARIDSIDESVYASVSRHEMSAYGRGGMKQKLQSIHQAVEMGIAVHLLPGSRAGALQQALAEPASCGTYFPPSRKEYTNRQKWILAGARREGAVRIDQKAVRAVRDQKKSLLAAGIVAVDGSFERGSVVDVCTERGERVGAGIVAYNVQELAKIKGKPSSQIHSILGYFLAEEIIHRDHLAVL